MAAYSAVRRQPAASSADLDGPAAGGRLFGSTSSTSEDKSPELNLLVVFVWVGCGCGRWCSSNRVFLIDSVVFQPPDK